MKTTKKTTSNTRKSTVKNTTYERVQQLNVNIVGVWSQLVRKQSTKEPRKHINNVKNPKPWKTKETTKEYKQQTAQEEIRDYIETSSDFECDINKE